MNFFLCSVFFLLPEFSLLCMFLSRWVYVNCGLVTLLWFCSVLFVLLLLLLSLSFKLAHFSLHTYFIPYSQTHSERAPENEWLDILPHPIFSPDGDSFLLLASIQETGTEHFTHIKHVTITQQRMSVISHGRYEVSIETKMHSDLFFPK